MSKKNVNLVKKLLASSVLSALTTNLAFASVPYKPVEVYNKQGQQLIGAEIVSRVMATEWTMDTLNVGEKAEISVKPLITAEHNIYFIPTDLSDVTIQPGRYLIEGADGSRFMFNYLGVPLEAANDLSLTDAYIYDSRGERGYLFEDGAGNYIAVAYGAAGISKEYVTQAGNTNVVTNWSGSVGPFASFRVDSDGKMTSTNSMGEAGTDSNQSQWIFKSSDSNVQIDESLWRASETLDAIVARGGQSRQANNVVRTDMAVTLTRRAGTGIDDGPEGAGYVPSEDREGGFLAGLGVIADNQDDISKSWKGAVTTWAGSGTDGPEMELDNENSIRAFVKTQMIGQTEHALLSEEGASFKETLVTNNAADSKLQKRVAQVVSFRAGLPAKGVMFSWSSAGISYGGSSYLNASPGDGLFLVKKTD